MRGKLTVIAFVLATFLGSASAQQVPSLPREASPPVPAPLTGEMTTGSRVPDPFRGGVPSGQAVPEEVSLSLPEAIARGLKNNLGLLLAEQSGRSAEGNRWRARSALLPDATLRIAKWAQQNNLDAFGFSGFPGIKKIVGPFDVFDARLSLSQPIVDLASIRRTQSATANLDAANYSYQNARETVVWVVATLYLRARAGASRVESARSQVETAQALYQRAVNFKEAGVVPAIEVLRSQVELQAQLQRLIFFQNEEEKQKLDLARAIGLSLDQKFQLTEELSDSPVPPLSLPEALERAYELRADYQSMLAQVRAGEWDKKAAAAARYPALFFNADYGDLGRSLGNSHGTFNVTASLRLPLFEGGRIHGNVLQAEALLQQRRSELADLRSRIEYEVRVAFLDLTAAQDQVQVAKTARELAGRQMEQAQDRFAAGVTSNIEVVQAQEALATADENYISGLYSYGVAKAALARALGVAEERLQQFLRGEK